MSLTGLLLAPGRGEAQYLRYSYPTYNYDLKYDWDNQRYGGFGVGFSPYDPILQSRLNYGLWASRYNLNNAMAAEAYEAANAYNQQAIAAARANAEPRQTPLPPRYDIDTRAPSTGDAPAAPLPGNALLSDDGQVIWPPEAPRDTDAILTRLRQAAEQAVQAAVQEYQANGRASARAVADAKRKLYAYGRPVLTRLKRTNNAAAYALLTFFQNLELTLDRMGAGQPPGAGQR
jgi:hypothetical protein